MKTFIVTGYSDKGAGLLYAVQAEDEVGAMREVAKLEEMQLVRIQAGAHKGRNFITHGLDGPQLIDELEANLGVARRSTEIWVSELAIGCNHPDAVCW